MKAVEIKALKKTYSNGFVALKGIDLCVNQGDFFALLGPNGAGKSTTIGIISSLVVKNSGNVSIYGHDLDQDPQRVKATIGLVPQEFNFNPFTKVKDILCYQAGYYGVPGKEAKKRAESLLKKLGLWDKRNGSARELSGGMKRRLLIARAMVNHPKLLILDEPTAGVDIELRRGMWDFLREINKKGTTIILTTHYLEEAEQLCDHIAIIDRGEIVENTDKKTLLSKLNMETLVLDLSEKLAETPKLSAYTSRLIDPSTLEVDISQGQNVNELFQELSSNKIRVSSLRNKTNRLEELFLNMVNKDDK